MYSAFVDDELFFDTRVGELALINPVVSLVANGIGYFKFLIPPSHPYYSEIQERKSIVRVFRDEETEPLFEGICMSVSTDIWKQKTVYCESELTFLNDTILRPAKYTALTSRQLLESYLNAHNAQSEDYKHFSVGSVTVKDSNDAISCYTNYNTTIKEIKEDLVDDLGGYLRVRHENGVRYLDYLKESPNTNTQVIKLGENLLTFDTNLDTANIANVIIPLGCTLETQEIAGLDSRLNIKSVNNNKDYVESAESVAKYGRIERVVTWDNVTVASNLKSKAEKYLSESQYDNVYITAKVVDLHNEEKSIEPFKMLDSVRVLSKKHGLDKYFAITKMQLNLCNPEKDTFTLGKEENNSLSSKLASENAKIKKQVEMITPASTILESAKDNASELIKTAQNGYVTMITDADGNPTELLIMDTNSKDTATKVWRWNVNGLGYSSTGYNGTYGTAMTMDGSIVADYITSGTMYANRIKGGTLSLGGNDNVNGIIEIKDSSNNVIGTWNKDGIEAKGSMTAGSDNSYKMVLSVGTLKGYYLGTQYGKVDPTAAMQYGSNTYRGICVEGDLVKLANANYIMMQSDNIWVSNGGRTSETYYVGGSGTFTAITGLLSERLTNFVNNLSIPLAYDGNLGGFYIYGDCSWSNTSFNNYYGYNSKSIQFVKGLMTTGL